MAINNPVALLNRLLQEPVEVEWLEFKHNNADPTMIGRTIAACANGAILAEKERAFMIWGVEDKTKALVGTSLRLGQAKGNGAENLANWLARVIEPTLIMDFADFTHEGKDFAIIAIDPAYSRPVKFMGQEYIRIGENVKSLKEFPDHERALWMATGRRKFETAAALRHQSQSDVLKKLDTSTFYKIKENPIPQNEDEIIRKFVENGFLEEDMEGGFNITNLGAILFATDLTIFPSIATKAIRVIQYKGVDKREAVSETEGKRGYSVGFEGLLDFIKSKLPHRETYINGLRKNVCVYSTVAIREFIANALIHQDFTISGVSPVIEIYQDRLEITNPGGSLLEVDRIIDGRRSRNEHLASAMREMGMCEERGGGIDKALLEIEDMSLPAPEFFSSNDAMRVVLFGPKTFSQLSKTDRIWACFCHCVVRWLRHDYMNNASLRARFSLTDEDYQAVSAVIADARKSNRIIAAEEGQGNRNARYVPYWAR